MISDVYTILLILIIGNIRESHFLCSNNSLLLCPSNQTHTHEDFEDVNQTTYWRQIKLQDKLRKFIITL